ncbi:hypothetical protein U1Q18_015432 [Sarracenia purpurea var. burkii]
MSIYQATHSADLNFAFELFVRRLESAKDKAHNLNLSTMVFLMVAAVPVQPVTLKRFIELTQPFGLSQEVIAPGFGLAENCVYVSGAFGKGKPIFIDWQERVCYGYVDPNDLDVDIRIVDPEVREVEPCPTKVIEQIQTHVAEEHGVVIASVVLIKPRNISKTTSGKIKIFGCLKQLLMGH